MGNPWAFHVLRRIANPSKTYYPSEKRVCATERFHVFKDLEMKIIIATMFVFSLVGSACQNTQQPLATSSAPTAESQSPAEREFGFDWPNFLPKLSSNAVSASASNHSGTAIWI